MKAVNMATVMVALMPIVETTMAAPAMLLLRPEGGDIVTDSASLRNVIPRGENPEGCTWDNGAPDYNPDTDLTPGSQYDFEFPFFAQVADDFVLTCPDECVGDVNGDGVVDPLDSGFVRSRFGNVADGSDPQDTAADVNNDCIVDAMDDGAVLSRFGPCEAMGSDAQVYVTQIIFHSTEYNPACGTPDDWTGVRVVVYNDADGMPDGEPQDDGTILGGPPVADVQIAPVAYTWAALDENRFEITLDVAFLLEKNVNYWLAISPQQSFVPWGQVGWNSTLEGNGVSALQHFAAAGIPEWTTVGGGPPAAADMAFTMIGRDAIGDTNGACCSDGVCEENVDIVFCQNPYDRFTTCAGGCSAFTPACGSGACCQGSEGCVLTTAQDCGGDFQGDGTTCGSTECPQPPPANDDCEFAIDVFDGDNVYSTHGATTDGPQDGAEGPCADDFVGFSDAWYMYTATCSGPLEVSLCKVCDGDTTLQIYEGTQCNPLGPQLKCGDDTCGIAAGPSTATVPDAVVGRKYLIRIGAWNDGSLPVTPTTAGIMTITCSEEIKDCCEPSPFPGCDDEAVETCVCEIDRVCCDVVWDDVCVYEVEFLGCGICP